MAGTWPTEILAAIVCRVIRESLEGWWMCAAGGDLRPVSQLAAEAGFGRNERDQRRAHHHVEARKDPISIRFEVSFGDDSRPLSEVLRLLGAFTGGRDGNIFLPYAGFQTLGAFRGEHGQLILVLVS